MEILSVEILDPKAKHILNNMAIKKLIRISEPQKNRVLFFQLLKNLSQAESPTLGEIQEEVKAVRKEMNKEK